MKLNELNEQFAISGSVGNASVGNGSVEFAEGANGFIKAALKHKNGSTLEVYMYGAHITSWTKPGFGELMFLSKTAEFSKGKGIRGGIPVIFPQFGNGDLPAHGFSRNRDWSCLSSKVLDNGDIKLNLVLSDNEETKAIWDFKFRFELEILLSDTLITKITVRNEDTKLLSFQQALHTYFKVGNIAETEVVGLQGLTYIDKVNGNQETVEKSLNLSFTTAFDRVYQKSPSKLLILDKKLKRTITIEKENMTDSVLWNPWEGAKNMKDMHEDAYLEMICVESANVIPKIVLQAGQSHSSSQTISVN